MQSAQQVNLYTEEFRPRHTVLPLAHILGLGLVLSLLLSAATYWLSDSAQNKELEALTRLAKAEALQADVEALAAKVGLLKQDDSLVRNNQKLRDQIRAREQMVVGLGTVAMRDSNGFSPYLIGLARQKVEKLWLQRIQLTDAGNSLLLEGSARKAEQVPAYLQKLNAEEVFSGYTFSVFDLELKEKHGSDIGFVLKSKNEASAFLVADNTSNQRQSLPGSNNTAGGFDGSP